MAEKAMSDEGFDENTLEFGEGEEEEECGVEIDRLSELPDSLLIHILSFLGVKRAGITSVLSKRWKFLWAELPKLEFREDNFEKTREFVSRVNRTLDIRKAKGDYLEKFLVQFLNYNNCFASDVDAWVEFSVKNEVKELALMAYRHVNYYKPPQVMYSCSSLTKLHLNTCILSSKGSIEWKSLTRLSLDEVELNQLLVDDILSNCPVLYYLDLLYCWGFSRLEVNSRCLNSLTIVESEEEPFVEISAPYLRDLSITVYPEGREWELKNITSLVSASIDFIEFYDSHSYANGLLQNFKHVEKLWIARECFQVLSKMIVDGWQLPKFSLRDLTLVSCSDYELSISGIIGMLESSPNLEALLLDGYETGENIFNLDPATKGDLDGDLLHLKTVRVDNFADPNGEPLLSLARILLRRAPALEKMKIVVDVEDTSDFVNIAQTLLTYPRSSTAAQIHLLDLISNNWKSTHPPVFENELVKKRLKPPYR